MPDSTVVEKNNSLESLFSDSSQKKAIFDKIQTALNEGLTRTTEKYPKSKDGHELFGEAFERMAKEENLENRPESAKEAAIREIIEDMYSQAEIILGTGNESPSRPDGVTVKFDEEGNLKINEILEFKSSLTALTEGIEGDQPTNTLRTIEDLVGVINLFIEGKEVDEITPVSRKLTTSEKFYRNFVLLGLQERILSALEGTDRVMLSDNLVYRVILPAWEEGIEFDEDHLQQRTGQNVEIHVSNSIFSKKDVHDVLGFFQK